MSTSFMRSPKLFFTSESVTEGHPDKMCDQISDAVLDALLAQDPMSRVACETATKTGFVILLGEITTNGFVNFDDLVRQIVREIGYTSSDFGFDAATCAVQVAIAAQSPDIALGYIQRIRAFLRGFDTFPERGSRRDDIRPGLRMVGFERRVTIAFVVEGDEVIFSNILYGGRQLPGLAE